MKRETIPWKALCAAALLSSLTAAPRAQVQNAHDTADFRIVPKEVQLPGHTIRSWDLCLSQYTVELAGRRQWIPVFPILEPVQFVDPHARAVDALERVSHAAGGLGHGERLEVLPAAPNAGFRGAALWTMPKSQGERPGLMVRLSNQDVEHFGFRADDSTAVAHYVKDVFEAMSRLFLRHRDPSPLDAVQKYPEAKILKRIWMQARQHAEMTRNVPRERSALAVTREDIQEALDMLDDTQRRRLLGMARIVPQHVEERN